MRFSPGILDRLERQFIGDNKSIGRVTVEPLWNLNSTGASYGGSVRGPYRWFQDVADSGVEWEVPNVKSIDIDRSDTQDIATCTITLSNIWHEGNLETAEDNAYLGMPGYFWPKRGLEVNRWGQLGGKGSFRKDGFWDPNFSWQNVLVPYALLRTWEGYGGHPTETNFVSVQDNIDNENVLITGTWLIDTVQAGSNGDMVLQCRDMGKLLLEQLCFPPTVPNGLYPLEYYPAGKTAFDSVFGPKPKTGVSPGSQGEVRSAYYDSSLDNSTGVPNSAINGHYGSHGVDGHWDTFSLSDAYALPGDGGVWWEFDVNHAISNLSIKPWAGGYDCYVSISRDGNWLGTETVPGTPTVKYVTKINLPHAIPDGLEPVTFIELPEWFDQEPGVGHAARCRITFRNLYYSGIPDGSGDQYRGGIRDLIFYKEGAKADPYSPDFTTLPWTFSMCAHPTRGYWVIEADGTVHGFGDAADYDSTAFGTVPLSAVHPDNKSIAMCAHPDGKGYWVLDLVGNVYAYGSATHYGEYLVPWPGASVWGEDGLAAWDITPTYTGNGYWVIYGDGNVRGFGDASPSSATLPWTSVGIYMNTVINDKWLIQHQGNGIAGHPTKMGFWATTGSGEVYAYGDAVQYGQLDQRVYNAGMADTFRLAKTEFTRSIEPTRSGNGYWVAFGSGHIAAFGDAVGQGPTYVYADVNPDSIGGALDIPIDPTTAIDWSFFRALVWDIARDPDGTGFWVLVAGGAVGAYNAEFWGMPSYNGLSGYRWHEGNYTGEFSDVIKELLSWSGFTLYSPSATDVEVFGAIESTGIKTDTSITAEKFDKRPILDIIKELCEVVAYRFKVLEDGSVSIGSSNIWRSGNFDENGDRIYVESGTNTRVDEGDPGAVEYIPLVDELVDLFEYSTSLNSESMRSEIIIGNDAPDPKNPGSTSFVRHTPRSGSELVASGVPIMRNIPRVGMWISSLFQNQEEMKLMAELISLNAWFAERTSTATCVANPMISIGDQVKFAERNTSEFNIHYVTGVNSSHNLETGEWTYTLTTHWLGDADNWVITASAADAPVDGYHYIEVSESVDRWQQYTNKGLLNGGQANGSLDDIVTLTGEFSKSSSALDDGMWEFIGTLTLNKRYDYVPVVLDALTEPLGTTVFCEVRKSGSLIANVELNRPGGSTSLPAMGHNGSSTAFEIKLKGYPSVVGNGLLKFSVVLNQQSYPASDTLLIVG